MGASRKIVSRNDVAKTCRFIKGTAIGTVVAYDADIGEFGHVTYLLDRRSSKVLARLVSTYFPNTFKRSFP